MELGCCGCRALASEVMIYCFASFDNWQMETTRCRAREGGKIPVHQDTPDLHKEAEEPHPVLPSAEILCWLWGALQGLWRHMERQPALIRVPVPSPCVLE